MRIRKKHPKEFKLDAVSLVLEQGYTRPEAARGLGIHTNVLGRWVREYQEGSGQEFRGNGKLNTGSGRDPETEGPGEAPADGERSVKKSDGMLCSRNEVKYSFITQHKNAYPISLQCQLLGVSRSGYYHYQASHANRPDDPTHQEVLEWVQDIAESSGCSYGSRRMKKGLNALGFPVSATRPES